MTLERPAVNTLIRVDVSPEATGVPSRVEGFDGGDLWIAAPAYGGDVEPIRPGAVVVVRWTGPRGLHAMSVEVTELERGNVATWRVRPVGDVEMVQRRQYVRAAVGDAVAVVPRSDGALRSVVSGWLVDLGEGGVRARFEASTAIVSDLEVEVHLNLRGQPVVLVGTVLRCTEAQLRDGQRTYEAVVTFEANEVQGDLIRRTVLHHQVAARRRAIG